MDVDDDNLAQGPDQQQVVQKYHIKSTLREKCLKSVFWHKSHHTLHNEEGLKNLPITLKTALLKIVTDDLEMRAYKYNFRDRASEEMCCFLATLMNIEITTLKLPSLNSTFPRMDFAFKRLAKMYNSLKGEAQMSAKELHEASCGVRMLINAIGAQCSNIKSLSIMGLSGQSPFIPLMPLTEGTIFGPSFFQVLPRLTSLEMNHYLCGDWALKQIGIHATNLVVLEVSLTLEDSLTLKVTRAGFEALSKLPHLQQFIFGKYIPRNDWLHEMRYLRLCTKYLPHLKVAGRHFNVMNVDDPKLNDLKLARGYHSELIQELKRPATLSLQLLNLDDDILPSKRLKFSDLKELILWNPSSRSLDWCDSHASLTALGLYEYKKTDITPVLHKVGQRLQSLALCDIDKEFSLAEVLQLCPHLTSFKVSSCKVKKDPDQWSDAAFSGMEETCFESVNLPLGFLKQILQCGTKLRKFKLSHCGMSNQGMKELIHLMKQTPMLPNIASISWYDNRGDWNSILHKELLETIEHKFPHAIERPRWF